MEIPFIAWILQGIPECIGNTALLISFDGKPLNWRIVAGIGVLQACIVYIIRLMPFTPGVHIFILPISLALLASKIGRVRLDKALIYAVIISVLIALWEIAFHFIFAFLGVFSFSEIQRNLFIRILMGIPQVLLLFLTAFIIQKRKLGVRVLREKSFALDDK